MKVIAWRPAPEECPPPGWYWFRDGGGASIFKVCSPTEILFAGFGTEYTWESINCNDIAGPIPDPQDFENHGKK